jgi:hypothetical protein
VGIGVAQDLPDDSEIHALFQQMGGVGMAHRVWTEARLCTWALTKASLKAIWTLATGMGCSAVGST